MAKHSKSTQEIRNTLLADKAVKDAKFLSRYIGSVGHEDRAQDEQSKLRFLGYSQPQLNAVSNMKFSFSELTIEEQLSIWLDLYHNSDVHDEVNLALIWISDKKRRGHLLANEDLIWKLQGRVDNWAISDAVAELVAALVETDPKTFFPQLKAWNISKNPWERRQSLVGIYCYARMRKKPVPAKLSLPLIENLLKDPHYFVQKAVGWSLREVYQVDREAQLAFCEKHIADISAIAFTAAIEKMSDKEKTRIKKLRALKRKKRKSA